MKPGSYAFWKIMEFKIDIIQAWKVMEAEKSWN